MHGPDGPEALGIEGTGTENLVKAANAFHDVQDVAKRPEIQLRVLLDYSERGDLR